jgi:uncharacterized DUF497 family protein
MSSDHFVFEWDERKSRANRGKHGVSFEEARTAFLDENARLIGDPEHSGGDEDRFVLLGMSTSLRILVVCHCHRDREVVRIISARKADRSEQRQYREWLP